MSIPIHHRLHSLYLIIASLILPCSLHATNLVNEPFNYTASSTLPSTYKTSQTSSTTTTLQTSAAGLTFTSIPSIGTAATLDGAGDQAWTSISGTINPNVDGTTVYTSFLIQYNPLTGYNNYGGANIGLSLGSASVGTVITFGFKENGSSIPGQGLFAFVAGGTQLTSTTAITANTTYFILTKTVFHGGTYTGTYDVYMNFYPSSAGIPNSEPTTWALSATGISKSAYWNPSTLINAWGFNDRGTGNNTYYGATLDAVNVGTTFADVIPAATSPTLAAIGVNLAGELLWTDVIRMAGHSQWNISTDLWGTTSASAATVDSNGWPTQDCSLAVWGTGSKPNANIQNTGTWTLVFNGRATVKDFENYPILPQNTDGTNGTYNSATNTTTATMSDSTTTGENFALIFTNTQRTGSGATNTGITNVHFYRPTYEGSSTSYPVGSVFTTQTLAMSDLFSVTRFMDQFRTINSTVTNWSDRNLPGFWHQLPLAYENAVAYCNATNTDLYVNIPLYATDAYITNLANLIKYGSDGVNPYSSVQTSPVYPPLNSNLHVYLEYSNEIWNPGFQQQGQNYNIVVADQTANNADWTILNFDGAAQANLWTGAWRHVALRAVQISNDFRAVYGNAAMPPNANAIVRPLIEFQAKNGQNTGGTQLQFVNDYFNNGDGVSHVTTPEPVGYYLWGGGGATYYDSNSDNASTVDAIFASGIPNTSGTTYIGSSYYTAIQTDAALVKSYGIKRVAYEGGWALYNGTNGTDNVDGSPAALAKYDTRATAASVAANTAFEQSGGDLNIFYTSSSFDINYVWGMTDSIFDLTVPLYAGINNINNAPPAAPTYGNSIAGTGATTLNYSSHLTANNISNAGIPDNGVIGWIPLISTGGNYQISVNLNSTVAGKYVKVLVDGQMIGGGPISVPVSGTAQNVVLGTVNLTAGQHGLILEGQYASNNSYTGNSCSFTSFVLTKVP